MNVKKGNNVDKLAQIITYTKRKKTHSLFNLKLKTDLSEISKENSLVRDELVSSAYTTARSVTKTSI